MVQNRMDKLRVIFDLLLDRMLQPLSFTCLAGQVRIHDKCVPDISPTIPGLRARPPVFFFFFSFIMHDLSNFPRTRSFLVSRRIQRSRQVEQQGGSPRSFTLFPTRDTQVEQEDERGWRSTFERGGRRERDKISISVKRVKVVAACAFLRIGY